MQNFVLGYEITAFIFLIILSFHFFLRQGYPSFHRRVFSVFAAICIADVFLEIVTGLITKNAAAVPVWLSFTLAELFYVTHVAMSVHMYLYVLVLSGKLMPKNKTKILITLLPAVAVEAVVILNPIFRKVFTILPDGSYHRQTLWDAVYVGSAVYLAVSTVILFINRRKFKSLQFVMINSFVFLCTAATLIQLLNRNMQVSGVAVSISVVLMYLTLENPSVYYDELTGLPNRDAFVLFLRERPDIKRCIIYFDVDRTRVINNVFGTSYGNEMLRKIGEELKNTEKNVYAYRIQGDCFAVVANDEIKCRKYVERIKEYFSQPLEIFEARIDVTVCIRYIFNVDSLLDHVTLISLLEYSMDESKDAGAGTVLEITAEGVERIARRMDVEYALRSVLSTHGLSIMLQPIYDTASQRYRSAEVLTRLTHPVYGTISPEEFIPAAEKNGLITELGYQVLTKVCEYIDENRELLCGKLDYIEINLSPAQLFHAQLPEKILAILKKYDIDPSFICLEITESGEYFDNSIARKAICLLSQSGIHFALDDYGTGYANLRSITGIPFSVIKVDKSMLYLADTGKKSALVLEHTISLFNRLGLTTVVEGVEDKKHAELVTKLGACRIQGYYYSKPLSPEEFILFLCGV